MSRWTFRQVVDRLGKAHSPDRRNRIEEPFELILFENAAYLVDDERRWEVFESLRKAIGTRPQDILGAAPADVEAALARGGMHPHRRAEKLRRCAEIAIEELGGDVRTALALPLGKARRTLMKFPGIGEPGADKILLWTGTAPILALDSNALRTLVRLGFAEEQSNYAAMYRSAQQAMKDHRPEGIEPLIRASELLRHHGQTLCRRTRPECPRCPLRERCPSG